MDAQQGPLEHVDVITQFLNLHFLMPRFQG